VLVKFTCDTNCYVGCVYTGIVWCESEGELHRRALFNISIHTSTWNVPFATTQSCCSFVQVMSQVEI